MLKLLDISCDQGDVDFAALRRGGISGVVAKATEGITYQDDHFAKYHDQARAAGMPFAAYHFLRPKDDPAEQAANFLQTIDGREGQLLPMLDIEVDDHCDRATIERNVAGFYEVVEKTLKGKLCLHYTFLEFWNETMQGSDAFAGHPLWIAEYNSDAAPTLPSGFKSWVIWQHTSSAFEPGVSGRVDLDALNGDDLSIISR